MNRLAGLERLYGLLNAHADRHGGRLRLADIGSALLPRRGVYFFFDENELRQDSGIGPRVVRVGTHALTVDSMSTLGQRLGQLRGARNGGGNHRGSIFRNLVGQAILAGNGVPPCPSWGIASDLTKASAVMGADRRLIASSEKLVENGVSNYLATLTLTYLDINDEPGANSKRGFVERHAIALLSNHDRVALDAPSIAWLGHVSNRELVRRSGLWNQRHVTETCAEEFLNVFETLTGKRPHERI